MTTAVLLQPTYLDFKYNEASRAKLTATENVITFSGLEAALVKLSGIAEPSANTDAATKNYVDSAASGVHWHEPVHVASTGNVSLSAIVNGSTVDGQVVSTGNRILLKNQTTGTQNGIYVVQAVNPLVRSSDMAVGTDAASEAVLCEKGTGSADTAFVCTNNSGSDVVGTDALVFVVFARAGETTAGAGLGRSGLDFFVNVDNSTIEISGDALRLKDAGVTNAKLANTGVTVTAGSALTGGGPVNLGTTITLDVAVDNSSIEVNSDALRVKALGVTSGMLAGSIVNGKLTNNTVTITAGNALSGGGTVSLGASTTLGVVADNSTIEVNAASVPAWTLRGADLVGEATQNQFGYDVAMSSDGSVIVVGTPSNDNNGGANSDYGGLRVFAWNGSAWVQRGSDIDGVSGDDQLGVAVAISTDGNTIAASSSYTGYVRVFTWSGSAWVLFGNQITHNVASQGFGTSLAMSGDGYNILTATRTSWAPSNQTFARAFSWSGTAWVQRGSDLPGHFQNKNGVTMDASGNNIAVGGVNSVRAYSWSGTDWQIRGSQIDGEEGQDQAGRVRISSDGNFLVIGSPNADGNGPLPIGTIRVYAWSGSSWVKRGSTLNGEGYYDSFGSAVTINSDGTIVAAGSTQNNTRRGHARVWSWSGTAWVRRGTDIDGTSDNEESGTSVAMSSDGSLIAISTPLVNTNRGRVRVYNWPKIGLSVKALGITNAMLAGSIANSKLANSRVTVTAGSALTGGGPVDLGATTTLDVAVDGSSIEVSTDALRVKALGITNAMLAGSIANSKLVNQLVNVTAGSALTGGGGVNLGASITLDVAVDGSTIEISSDALRVKDAGITNAKLANSGLTVSAGDGLASGGLVNLGSSVSLTVDSTVVRTSGAQSIGGTKTFSSAAVVSDTTASTSHSTGCLTLAGGLGTVGSIYANDETYATEFNATSDATLKRDIVPISGALDTISRITPVEYRFNFLDNDTLHYGVLAQELEEKGLGDIVRHGNNGKLAVEYNSLTGLLLAAVKDLGAQVQELQNRVRFD